MTKWIEQRLCVFDVETTGVDTEKDHIVSACIAFVGGGDKPRLHEWLLAVEIPEEASKIHGITTEFAAANGMRHKDGISEIRDTLLETFGKMPVVGFNMSFDLSVLKSECNRYGLDINTENIKPIIDVFILDRHYERYRKGSRKLDAVAAAYGVKVSESHKAGADALNTGRTLWRMAQKHQEILELTPTELHYKQVVWSREQAEHLREYRLEQGSLLAALESAEETIWDILHTTNTHEALDAARFRAERIREIINKAKASRDDRESSDGSWPISGR